MHTPVARSSFKHIMWVRVYQASGLAFLFIPINTITYTGVPRVAEQRRLRPHQPRAQHRRLLGTAFVATMLTRGSQRHEAS
jgi:DHA2 family multidrug resistance protein